MKFFPLTLLIIMFLLYANIASGAPCGPSADGSYILCESIPGIDPVQKDFASFFSQLYRLALIVGGTVIFIQIVRGGIMYTLSGVINYQQRAKEILANAAKGGALLMGSYLILHAINPALTTITVPDISTYAPSPNAQTTTGDRRILTDSEITAGIIRQNEAFVEATRERIKNLEAAMARGRGGPAAEVKLDALYDNLVNKEAEIVRLKQKNE